MRKNRKRAVLVVSILLLASLAACGVNMGQYEEPNYTVVRAEAPFEIRDYAPSLVAEAVTKGPRQEAISEGFRIIADYIFGNNTAKNTIAMTTPVSQASENIAMTTPVTQSLEGKDGVWRTRFTMPSKYTRATLPTPNDTRVLISEAPAKRFAVIRFSWSTGDDNLKTHQKKLEDWVAKEKLKALSPASYSFYNPPWTLPFLRRNEVWIEIAKE
ncbi:MAG: SOUL family heme-binding protein [Rickettsiales bacterium]